ncbi:MAG: hypothetical protein ABI718_07910 [Acidobacteriota bacterium]
MPFSSACVRSAVSVLICAGILSAPASVARSEQTAPEPTEEVVAETVVPVVANVIGLGEVEWRTQLFLRNDTGSEVDVAVTMPGVPGPFYFTTLPAGGSAALNDLVHDTFGITGAIDQLLIRTSGRYPVTAIATIYGVHEGSVVGTQQIPALAQPPFGSLRLLSNLILSDTYRTNVGLVNYSDNTITFSMALQRIAGRDVATTMVTIPAHSVRQLPIQMLFPLIAEGGTFSIVADASSPLSYAYASVLNNETIDARFVGGALTFYHPF